MDKDNRMILPYGDTLNDGKVQLSFTLPIAASETAIVAAKEMAKNIGLVNPEVAHMQALDPNFTMFVVYGSCYKPIDLDTLPVTLQTQTTMIMEEVEAFIATHIKRDIVVLGATTGTDAHTVGLDAIMNMKGLAGHYGLERYQGIAAINMGSQVDNEEFIKKAKDIKADVLLVSQTVTQKDVHVHNLVNLVELLEAENLRDDVILIVGGARITNELAKELGYDAGFGFGKFAEDVATFFVTELKKRIDIGGRNEKSH